MIIPRTTRLVRVADLQSMHAATAALVGGRDPFAARDQVVLVPTRSAAEALRRTLEWLLLERSDRAVCVLPELLTRADLYVRLHAELPGAPPLLTEFDREVIFRRAARASLEGGTGAPFKLRPGLIVQMLAFYDELRRRDRTIADFERLLREAEQNDPEGRMLQNYMTSETGRVYLLLGHASGRLR